MTDDQTEAPEALDDFADDAAAAPPEPQAPTSARDSVAAALASLEISDDGDDPAPVEADDDPEPVEASDGPARDPETGKFVAKDKPEGDAEEVTAEAEEAEPVEAEKPDEYAAPPARFTAAAKEAWKAAPPEVRAEVQRTINEMERGLSDYQQKWAPLKEWDDLARQHGITIDKALERYTTFERNIKADPVNGLRQTCAELGLDFGKVIEAATGEPQDAALGRYESKISQMEQHIQRLEAAQKQALQSVQEQAQAQTLREVEAFATEHPRFDELSADIAFFIKSGRTNDLSEAYNLAERLNPAPVVASAPAAQTRTPPAPAAQTRTAANLSIAGAPGPGSNPAARRVPTSANDAVKQALAAAGL